MNHHDKHLAGSLAAVTAIFGIALQGCSSGSGGSNVGGSSEVTPTARAQVLNGGRTNTFREGSDVLLTGKDSEDGDGPLLGWSWRQSAGPSVRLLEVNRTTSSFTAPSVSSETTLTFELTVSDVDKLTDTASIDVTVIPAADADKFLSLDVRGATQERFDHFHVIAALAEGASTDSSPKPFTLSVRAYLVYPPRSNPGVDCPVDPNDFAAGVPAVTMTGCFVELLEDLTPAQLPGGGTGLQSEWPANVPIVVRPGGLTASQIESEWWNPRFTLRIPRLDVADFNQQFVDSGERGRLLDLFNAHKSRVVLSFGLTAPENQQDATLILNDLDNVLITGTTPVTPTATALTMASPKTAWTVSPKLIENRGVGLPTSSIVQLEEILGAIDGRESALTGEVYYRTVDPLGTRTTLNAWLRQAGFASDDHGTLRPEAVAGTGEFAHGVYVNNYDLGFGRDMYTRTDEFGNVYAFVVNYPTLEAAIRKSFPFATVAMEYSPLNRASDPTEKFVKFFTYADARSGDSPRVTSMDFDGRGERFTPGNCIACHGGVKPPGLKELVFDEFCEDGQRLDAMCYTWPETTQNGIRIANGDLKATFLPWDLDSLLFADTDPAITDAPIRFDGLTLGQRLVRDHGDFSRGTQEAQFRKLNQAAYATYCNAAEQEGCSTDVARRLVEHWYGGVDQNGNLAGSTFNDAEALPGWRNGEQVPSPSDRFSTVTNPETAEEIYHDVYARHCRMCHTNIAEETLRFDTYQKFVAQAALIEQAVFERGVMPGARLTADRLWVPDGAADSPAEILAALLGIEPVNGQLGPAPKALVTGARTVVPRHDAVQLSGFHSTFASSFAWRVHYEPVPELLAINPDIANFEPTLIGASTSELSFVAAKPGTYTVDLTINEAEGSPTSAEPVEFSVPNFTPQAGNLELALQEGGSRTLSVLEELNLLCAVPDCVEVFGDGPSSISVNIGAWNASDGDLTLDDSSTGTITLEATAPGPITASIPFTVTDTDLETANAFIEVVILPLAAPVAVNDPRSMSAQSTLLASPRQLSIAVLGNDSVDPNAQPLMIHSFTQPPNGTVTQSGNNLVYEPDLGFVGADQFTYRAIDSSIEGRISDPATVTVTVTPTSRFSSNVQVALTNAGCLSCHENTGQNIAQCSPGTRALAPDWTVYGNVKACVNPPGTAGGSTMLTWPLNAGHGGIGSLTGTDYQAVFRWIEEGARNN